MTKKPAQTPEEPAGRKRRPTLRLAYVIGSLDRILRRRMTEALAPLGLTLSQFTAMSVLASRGWITREPDPTHGRIVLLQLTDEGRDVLRQCEQVVRALEAQMLAGIEADVASSVQGHLETFVRNLRG